MQVGLLICRNDYTERHTGKAKRPNRILGLSVRAPRRRARGNACLRQSTH